MTESEKQNVIRALNTLAKHKSIYGCQQCSKTAEFALQLIEEQQQILEQQKQMYGDGENCHYIKGRTMTDAESMGMLFDDAPEIPDGVIPIIHEYGDTDLTQ